MKIALHGVSLWHSNAVTQLRIAGDCGFDALEILPEHLYRYLDNGGSFDEFRSLMKKHSVEISCINALKRIGRHSPEERRELLRDGERISRAAHELGCPVVQIMALNEIDELDRETRDKVLIENIRDIADIGKKYGIRFQIEVVAFTSFNTLAQGLEIIEKVDRDNVGMVIDFWHLHCGGTKPEELSRVESSQIYGIHLCDGRPAREGEEWDEWILRDYPPEREKLISPFGSKP